MNQSGISALAHRPAWRAARQPAYSAQARSYDQKTGAFQVLPPGACRGAPGLPGAHVAPVIAWGLTRPGPAPGGDPGMAGRMRRWLSVRCGVLSAAGAGRGAWGSAGLIRTRTSTQEGRR